jgi:hypothetical protein
MVKSGGERPLLRHKIQIESISAFITQWFVLYSPASFRDVACFIAEEFGIQMLGASVRHYIAKLPRFRFVKGIPINIHCFGCDPPEIDHYYDTSEAVL